MHTIAFTGHRPKDLPREFERQQVYSALHQTLTADHDYHFVTGGALGIDTWAADYAFDMGFGLTLILPFPVSVMTKFWHPDDEGLLWTHRQMADEVIVIGDSYNPAHYQRRNEAMVDRADEVIAFWTGKPFGGTANCINYALRVDKPIRNLLPGGPEFGS